MFRIKSKTTVNLTTYIVLFVLTIIALVPVIWMILTSFKPPRLVYESETLFFKPVFTNYKVVFLRSPMFKYLKNSIFVALVSTGLAMVLSVPVAYSLARFNIGGDNFSFWILSTRMMPPIVVTIPLFMTFRKLGLLDTRIVLILPYLIFQIPFAVWMMRGFFMEIPEELEEAAMVDGCSRISACSKITLPLSLPGLAATAMFSIVFSWGEFLFALIFTGTNAKTLPVAAASYITEKGIMWGEIAATGSVIMIPMLILLIIVQKYLVRALTFGALKG